MKITFSEAAADQLIQIYLQGAITFGESQVLKYKAGLEHVLELISFQPFMGRRVREEEHLRVFSYGQHLIVYEVRKEEVFIVNFVDARSDYKL